MHDVRRGDLHRAGADGHQEVHALAGVGRGHEGQAQLVGQQLDLVVLLQGELVAAHVLQQGHRVAARAVEKVLVAEGSRTSDSWNSSVLMHPAPASAAARALSSATSSRPRWQMPSSATNSGGCPGPISRSPSLTVCIGPSRGRAARCVVLFQKADHRHRAPADLEGVADELPAVGAQAAGLVVQPPPARMAARNSRNRAPFQMSAMLCSPALPMRLCRK